MGNLHSNLVIFKYSVSSKSSISAMIFTFQSGDIQMQFQMQEKEQIERFTFQSGDIQINDSSLFNVKVEHSFTFQSGDIQIYQR